MITLLLGLPVYAETNSLSAMVSEDSWQLFQELEPEVQWVISNSLYPQVMEKVDPRAQKGALEAIIRVTHEQQSSADKDSRGWMYGTDIQQYSTITWTGNTSQMAWIYAHLHLAQSGGYNAEDDDECYNCYSAIASLSLPNGPGEYYAYGTHEGSSPYWGNYSSDWYRW